MGAFTEILQVEPVPDRKGLFRTTKPFTFFLDDTKTGEYLHVPAGVHFNGASIPVRIQKLFGWQPMDWRWLQATVIHDMLVGEHGVIYYTSEYRRLSWDEAADWFDVALRVKRSQYPACPKLNRVLFVKAVKIYGKLAGKK